MAVDDVLAEARAAKDAGATRFCMGAAWREPKDRDLDTVCEMVAGVKALGLETCATLGMLDDGQARARSRPPASTITTTTSTPRRSIYGAIITTRTYQDRLDTLGARARCRHQCLLRRHRRHGRERARTASACSRRSPTCRSIPKACRSTCWCRSRARRCRRAQALDPLDFVRTIAVARICMPKSVVRLSAGREDMSEETAGAVLPRRRQFDLLRDEAAHHAQSGA